MTKAILTFVLLILLVPKCGWSQISEKKAHLKEYETKISNQKKRLQNLLEKEGSILDVLKELKIKEEELSLKIENLTKSIAATRKTISLLQASIQELEKRIDLRQQSISSQLQEIYKHGEINDLRIMLGAQSFSQVRKSQWLLGQWMESDKKEMDQFTLDVAKLEEQKKQLEQKQRQLGKDQVTLSQRKAKLVEDQADREKVLYLVQNQKDFYQKSIRELEKSATNLQKLIEKLQSSQSQAGEGFAAMKGNLIMPVKGVVEKTYGSYFDQKLNTKLYHKGIDVRAKAGSPVTTIFDGEIVYVDWFDGYGRIVIVDHGSGFFSLYAHLDKIFVKPGDQVVIGTSIATVGDTGSLKGAYLYFELRQKGISIDPVPWFSP
ncbi:MAG: peptidoglycan DD-metalloendopeptidase family protein [Bdellovibrionota bacterium]